MKNITTTFAAIAALTLAACSSQEPDAQGTEAPEVAANETPAATASPNPVPEDMRGPKVLRLEGLADLEIGKPIPAGSSFKEGSDEVSEGCLTAVSRDYPGVNAMTINGVVKRISVADGSDVKLFEGIGPGSTLAEVREAFPGFVEEPHKYTGPQGKYLTQPGNDPRLRFEISPAGKVTQIHVGVMPQLGYVEGCA